MSQESQEKPGGNTKTPGPKNQYYRFFIVIPHEEAIKPEILSKHFKEIGCKKFSFQLEKGDSTGYLHWSCEVSLVHKEYMACFKNLLGFHNAHIEPTKNYFAAKNYNSKLETRELGPFDQDSVFIETIVNLRPWQVSLKDELLKPVEYFSRKIIWMYNNTGNYGKSEFARYMLVMHNACVFQNAKTSDIAYALGKDPKIILFDLPRQSEDQFNFNYSLIESLKNGLIFSSKYESGTKVFNKPHICILANNAPDRSALTSDKWDIRIV